jgi:hypothetical protein
MRKARVTGRQVVALQAFGSFVSTTTQNGIDNTATKAGGLDTKIWLLDHNFNLWGRVYNSLEHSDAYKYVDGIAWHPCVSSVTAMGRIHDAYPTQRQCVTEGGFAPWPTWSVRSASPRLPAR